MDGASQYAPYFQNGERVGKLSIGYNQHARRSTFYIYVVADGKSVPVYGVVSGTPGWDETYGWLHQGPWQADFLAEYARRHELKEREDAKRLLQAASMKAKREWEEQQILKSY